jgi:hypothetical protein
MFTPPQGVYELFQECRQNLAQMRISLLEMDAVTKSSRNLLDHPWNVELASYAAKANVASYDAAAWLHKAEEARSMADMSCPPDVRRALEDIAACYEALALAPGGFNR